MEHMKKFASLIPKSSGNDTYGPGTCKQRLSIANNLVNYSPYRGDKIAVVL
jgi:hypothetical protein